MTLCRGNPLWLPFERLGKPLMGQNIIFTDLPRKVSRKTLMVFTGYKTFLEDVMLFYTPYTIVYGPYLGIFSQPVWLRFLC